MITVEQHGEETHTERKRDKQTPSVGTNYQSAEGKTHKADDGGDAMESMMLASLSSGNELVERPHVRPWSGFV